MREKVCEACAEWRRSRRDARRRSPRLQNPGKPVAMRPCLMASTSMFAHCSASTPWPECVRTRMMQIILYYS